MEYKELFKKIFSSFIPSEYSEFAEKGFKDVFKHLFFVLFIFIMIMAVTNIPKVVMYPAKFSSEFEKFETFNISVNASASEVVDLWLFKIDTNNNSEISREGVMFSKDYLQIKYLRFMPPIKEDITLYKNLVTSSSQVMGKLILFGVLLIPSLLFASYLYYLIKFMLFIIIATLIGFIIARVAKHEISFSAAYKACIFASPMLMLELVVRVFNMGIWVEQLIPLILFLVYCGLGIWKAGNAGKGRKKGVFETIPAKGHIFSE
ncbi:DUF1189 domain-containing protein [Candidatus Woesearchaeota archaeon]|nr:DUF1189 domain-containing protein [Candidatus Woesearchaeota archaeon]